MCSNDPISITTPRTWSCSAGRRSQGAGGRTHRADRTLPTDRLVYLDLDFLRQLQARFGAFGDAAQAYIVAHEVAHHVQNELGIMADARGGGQDAAIALELQADCFAGVWFSTLRSGTSAAVLDDGGHPGGSRRRCCSGR